MSTISSIMFCQECRLDGGPYSAEEHAILAATHDRIHHRGRPTASAMAAAVPAEASAA